ncbi:hypothetical protein BGZ82_003015 [Podila clonocystis]|nr:hypothetical protein BGZ82_003015 [Podila clonocystis]
MKTLANEMGYLERLAFEDIAYPSIFDQTFNHCFSLSWERDPTAETTKPQSTVPQPEEHKEDKEDEVVYSLTLTQGLKQLLEQAEEMMSKVKISTPKASKASTSGGEEKEKKLECGCADTCSCACAKDGGKKLACEYPVSARVLRPMPTRTRRRKWHPRRRRRSRLPASPRHTFDSNE